MLVYQRIDDSEKSKLIRNYNAELAKAYGIVYRTFVKSENPADDLAAIKDALAEISKKREGEFLLYVDENGLLCPSVANGAFAKELLGDSFAAFASDVGSESDRWNPGALCASQGLFRDTPDAARFFDDWIQATKDAGRRLADRLTNQRTLNAIYPQWSNNGVRVVYDYYRLAARKGSYIRQTYIDGVEATRAAIETLRALYSVTDESKPLVPDEAPAEETAEPAEEPKPKKTSRKTSTTKKKA